MRITTWNINSIRARAELFSAWLAKAQPDVLCLQETKAQDKEFPAKLFEDAGYHVAFYGQKTYNGVAIAARAPLEDVERGLPLDGDPEARGMAATVFGLRVINVYVVNGKELGDPKWHHKLRFLDALAGYVEGRHRPDQPLVVCGDWNLCPADRDTWDPGEWHRQIFCTEEERAPFRRLLAWGLHDAFRSRYPETWGRSTFTWWDYRGGGFARNHGLRIDHHLVTAPVLARTTAVEIDREVRKHEKASDHAPVTLVLRED
jgi:exodeoxyribonuclease-3